MNIDNFQNMINWIDNYQGKIDLDSISKCPVSLYCRFILDTQYYDENVISDHLGISIKNVGLIFDDYQDTREFNPLRLTLTMDKDQIVNHLYDLFICSEKWDK